jgi:DNA-binding transcriptional MerR regulator
MYRTLEFANLAGVTVRTLRYYDRLGLLRPQRNGSGYRAYRERDLERLEQIVALKFLGMPLAEIQKLLDASPAGLPAALAMQRKALVEKRGMLDKAICATREAETVVAKGDAGRTEVLKRIIEVMEVENSNEWMKKYQSEAAQAKIEARKPLWNPEMQKEVSRQWTELIADVEANLGEDPLGPAGQALGARWKKLVEGFTGGDPDITHSVAKMWSDRANWPESAKQQTSGFQIKPEVWAFIGKALGWGKGGGVQS